MKQYHDDTQARAGYRQLIERAIQSHPAYQQGDARRVEAFMRDQFRTLDAIPLPSLQRIARGIFLAMIEDRPLADRLADAVGLTKDDHSAFSCRRVGGNWLEGMFEGHRFQAQVFDEPSRYGIAGGCVSKLYVCAPGAADWRETVYEYDRGLGKDETEHGVIDRLLAAISHHQQGAAK